VKDCALGQCTGYRYIERLNEGVDAERQSIEDVEYVDVQYDVKECEYTDKESD
jgi:hypothetical protein